MIKDFKETVYVVHQLECDQIWQNLATLAKF